MEAAIKAVREGSMGYLLASKTYDVPKTTLKRRVKKTKHVGDWVFKGKDSIIPEIDLYLLKNVYNFQKFGGFPTVFTEEQEQEIVKHILDMESRFFLD